MPVLIPPAEAPGDHDLSLPVQGRALERRLSRDDRNIRDLNAELRRASPALLARQQQVTEQNEEQRLLTVHNDHAHLSTDEHVTIFGSLSKAMGLSPRPERPQVIVSQPPPPPPKPKKKVEKQSKTSRTELSVSENESADRSILKKIAAENIPSSRIRQIQVAPEGSSKKNESNELQSNQVPKQSFVPPKPKKVSSRNRITINVSEETDPETPATNSNDGKLGKTDAKKKPTVSPATQPSQVDSTQMNSRANNNSKSSNQTDQEAPKIWKPVAKKEYDYKITEPVKFRKPKYLANVGSSIPTQTTDWTLPLKIVLSVHQVFSWNVPRIFGGLVPDVDFVESEYARSIFKAGELFYFIGKLSPKSIGISQKGFSIEGGVFIWLEDIHNSAKVEPGLRIILEMPVRNEDVKKAGNIKVLPLKDTKRHLMSIIHSNRFPAANLLDQEQTCDTKSSPQRRKDCVSVDITPIFANAKKKSKESLFLWICADSSPNLSLQITWPSLVYIKEESVESKDSNK